MRKLRLVAAVGLLVLAWATAASAQQPTLVCTDATNTNCTVKKHEPFTVTADDPALTTDTVLTERWRLYRNGALFGEQANTGVAPLFPFATGLPDAGANTFYLEALGTAYDVNGQPIEVASGPSNVVSLTVVTGSLSAPKNLRIVR